MDVSPFALSNPNLDSYIGVMHALFYLEENYGLIPTEIDGQVCLKFKDQFSSASNNLENWFEEYEAMLNAESENVESAIAHYKEWKSGYPCLSAEKTMKALRSRKNKE